MKEYVNALDFWNKWFEGQEPDKEEDLTTASQDLAEHIDLIAHGKVLDFGCGAGWASIALAKRGADEVVGVDQAPLSLEFAKKCIAFTNVGDKIELVCADHNYLATLPDGCFDACFSSNTLDVIPFDITMQIVKQIHRVIKKNATFVMMLNSYSTKEYFERVKMVKIEGEVNAYSYNGNLRCVNFTEKEWEDNLKDYFAVQKYTEFHFEGEDERVKRRLFILTAK